MTQRSINWGARFCPAGSWFFPRSANSRSRNVASEGRHPYVPGAVPEEGRSGKDGVAVPRPSGTGSRPDQAELEVWRGSSGGSDRGHLATREVAIILPDAMHDHGEFACHRHFRAAHADPCREQQPPAAQCAGAHMPGEQGIGRFE
jgi:hypothetical protein